MKQIATIFFSLLLVLSFLETAEGQNTIFSDDFEVGNLNNWSNNEDWSASDSSSINGTYSLQHTLSDVESSSFITTSISAAGINSKVTTWQFNLKNGSWDPSGGNYFGFAILGDEADPQSGTFNGYVVGINFTGTSDLLTLYKVTDGSYSSIITTDFDWDSGNLIGIEIKRSSTGFWQLFYDTDGDFDNLIVGGSTTDTDHTTFSNLSVYFEFTSTRAGELWVDDILVEQEDETVKEEPSDHVTDFTATGSIKSVSLSWSDVKSSPTPDGYLIKANDDGFASITEPTDSNTEPDDPDLSDGSATLNVLQGIEEASFSGLDETTTYYFKIYPYTNRGSDIDYKTDETVPKDEATTLETPDIVLNEFLADPDATNGDANGDGVVSSDDDEFIEFVNTGNSILNISGWTIEDEVGTRYTFPESTILEAHQAIVIFGGGSPSGDFGGAIVKTTGSLSLNNSGDTIILKNDSNVEIINYSYGSEAGNDESITRSPELTGNFAQHSNVDPLGTIFSPGTQVGGYSFLPFLEISGNEGWRMLSSPTSDNSYNDLLGDLWTQCSQNAKYYSVSECAPTGSIQPNVQHYDANAGFEAVPDLDAIMTAGNGFILYVYSDDDYDQSPDNAGFPKTLEMFGTENTGTINPTLNSGPEAATLVGNPFLVPIAWDKLDKTDLSGTVYVYDNSYGTIDGSPDQEVSGVSGSYRAWNGEGSLTGGLIAPFQGFWVINSAEASSPSLQITKDESVQGGTFFKKSEQDNISIHLRAEMNNMFNEAFFSFNQDGQIGKDNLDGYELTPLDYGNYITLSTEVEGTQMDINNLPVELYNPVEVPLHVQAFEAVESGWAQMGGEVTLSCPEMNNIPAEWEITLTDTKLNRSINLRNAENYVFEAEGSRSKVPGKKPFSHLNPEPLQKEKSISDARFLITINPNVPDGMINDDIPNQFTLEQNYPNPFNPTTNIKFEIAETSNVTLNVYNVMGQRVATLVNEVKAPGTYEIAWDAQKMASGIYYYRLRAGGVVFNRQMTLIK